MKTDEVVLLVDDEPNVLSGLERILRKEPYQILTASSADEALSLMKDKAVDVVVSDQKMPGMSGTEFLATIRKQYPESIRIMLTGEADLQTAMEAINDGEIYRFFTKPCNEIDLTLSIREALSQKRLINNSKRLMEVSKKQSSYINKLEQEVPGITSVERDAKGAIVIDQASYNLDEILEELNEELGTAERLLGKCSKKD